MSKTLEQKKAIIATLEDAFKKSKSAVFVSFDRLGVAEVTKLREQCMEKGVKYITAKKTLLLKVLKASHISTEALSSSGQVAVAFGLLDEISPAKILFGMSKTHEGIKLIGGIVEKKYVVAESIVALAALPPKEELLAKLLGTLVLPARGMVSVLSASMRDFVNVLDQVAKQKI